MCPSIANGAQAAHVTGTPNVYRMDRAVFQVLQERSAACRDCRCDGRRAASSSCAAIAGVWRQNPGNDLSHDLVRVGGRERPAFRPRSIADRSRPHLPVSQTVACLAKMFSKRHTFPTFNRLRLASDKINFDKYSSLFSICSLRSLKSLYIYSEFF